MILLDTHVWVWWVSGSHPLSDTARRAIEQHMAAGTIRVSAISVWEVALLVKRGRLELTMDVGPWIAASESLPYLDFVPIDHRIAQLSVALPDLHDDPADCIIAATATVLDVTLVTRDRRLREWDRVETLW